MHEPTKNLTVQLEGPNTTLRAAHGWGTMSVAYAELPAGTDLGPLLAGLTNDVCACPHWGYLLKGQLHVRYSDDTVEVIHAGDVYYLPPGHTGWFTEDSALVEFSPDPAYQEVLAHVLKKAGATA
ncbi:MAG: cupin domain-containing protein [Caldilineaceae bacterium]